jgi:hypothetical protein
MLHYFMPFRIVSRIIFAATQTKNSFYVAFYHKTITQNCSRKLGKQQRNLNHREIDKKKAVETRWEKINKEYCFRCQFSFSLETVHQSQWKCWSICLSFTIEQGKNKLLLLSFFRLRFTVEVFKRVLECCGFLGAMSLWVEIWTKFG